VAKKTKISNGDLTALFHERLKQSPECPDGIKIAIIPDERLGWTALMGPTQRTRHPLCAKRVEAIQKQLRATYELARDDPAQRERGR
jgi:hypothetical protein